MTDQIRPPEQYQQAVLAALAAYLGPEPAGDAPVKKTVLGRDPTRVVFDDRQFGTLTFLLSALVGSINRMTDSVHRDSVANKGVLEESLVALNAAKDSLDKVAEAIGKLKPEPPPVQPKGLTIMSTFKLPADQPDFEIELSIEGGEDSEGHPTTLEDIDIVVENSNEAAFVGTLVSQTLSDDKNSIKAIVGAHVADPSPDLGVVAYKAINRDTGNLVGAGSDEFLIGAGEVARVAKITSTVPFTPEPAAPPVEPPVEG